MAAEVAAATLVGRTNASAADTVLAELSGGKHVIVFGESGSGKSTFIETVLRTAALTYETLDVKGSAAGSGPEKQIKGLVERYVQSKTIDGYFSTGVKTPKADRRRIIAIDDVDIHMRSDRSFATFLSRLMFNGKNNNPDVLVMVACCAGTPEEKRLKSDFARKTARVAIARLCPPSLDECAAYFGTEEAAVRALHERYNGNLGAIKTALALSGGGIGETLLPIEAPRIKPAGESIELLKNLMARGDPKDPGCIKELALLGAGDYMLPFLVYENAPKLIAPTHTAHAAVLQAMIDADIYEHAAYQLQDWSMSDVAHITRLCPALLWRRSGSGGGALSGTTPVLAKLALNAQYAKRLNDLRGCAVFEDGGDGEDEVFSKLDELAVSGQLQQPEVLEAMSSDQLTTALQYVACAHGSAGYTKTAIAALKREHAKQAKQAKGGQNRRSSGEKILTTEKEPRK
jgi:ABC-type oligopeptide transport system ATPase subunit